MSLYVIGMPIGPTRDITWRAVDVLSESDLIIGEQAKVTRRQLKACGLSPQKPIEVLNEHSTPEDIEQLLKMCANKKTALISDTGTPAFCDPGAELVQACHNQGIPVHSVPGPSSLTTFLSVAGTKCESFYFRGFLSAKTQKRQQELAALKKESTAVLLMDTPYRLQKLLSEIETLMPKRKIVLGVNLSQDDEQILRGTAGSVIKRLNRNKAEFVLLLEAQPPAIDPMGDFV